MRMSFKSLSGRGEGHVGLGSLNATGGSKNKLVVKEDSKQVHSTLARWPAFTPQQAKGKRQRGNLRK